MKTLVTKETLRDMINNSVTNKDRLISIVGRALVVVFKNQSKEERQSNTTEKNNGIGFSSCDARSGSITAKYYIKHGTLLDWQIDKWINADSSGYPKIAKYYKQLNYAANAKLNNVR